MNELLGNFLAPRIRGETMQLHPVLLLFFSLAFARAFGVLGAMVATPAAAFFSAFYNEFYLRRGRPTTRRGRRTDGWGARIEPGNIFDLLSIPPRLPHLQPASGALVEEASLNANLHLKLAAASPRR